MRRAFAYILGVGLLCAVSGCGLCTTIHGVCDCYQLTPCCTRQPWIYDGPPIVPVPIADGPGPIPETAPAPVPASDAKKL